jgi:hypothetical protein
MVFFSLNGLIGPDQPVVRRGVTKLPVRPQPENTCPGVGRAYAYRRTQGATEKQD